MSTVLITGANRGIGLELCRLYAARGDEVLAVCRRGSPQLQPLGVRVIEDIDVTRDGDAERLRSELGERRIDGLIHNAGLLVPDDFGSAQVENVRRQIEVNAIAPLRLTQVLASRIVDGGKVAIVTSRMGSMADNGSGGQYGYRMSKAAVNAAGKSMSIDLAGRGISVVLLHPGWVRTGMTGNRGDVTADEAARGLVERIDELDASRSGRFVHASGDELPW
ncbi:MAG: SDR family oxidoreductase [Myxococcales bacterium FL481]|nr:MAG: SDR family oxidoreductase [Myxococcales bacterium FL481]